MRMSRAWAGGSTRRWRKIRAAVLARDGYRCRLRIEDVCTSVATEAHHTRGRSVTGDDPRYLVAACGPCNRHIGDPQQHEPDVGGTTRW